MLTTISDFLKRSSPILKYSALSAVLVFLMILGYNSIGSSEHALPAGQTDKTPTALAGCSRVDETFCQTEHDFKQYVAARSGSDLFEHQASTTVTCDGRPSVAAYCGKTTDGLQIHLRAVSQHGSQVLLVRNDYIKLMREYFSQNGPFSYSSTQRDGPAITMSFMGKNPASALTLRFEKQAGGWSFAVPELGV